MSTFCALRVNMKNVFWLNKKKIKYHNSTRSSTVCFQNIWRLFLETFHTTEKISILYKTMQIGFFNLLLQYFQNIFILWNCKKNMEIGFFDLFLQYLLNISILWKSSKFSCVLLIWNLKFPLHGKKGLPRIYPEKTYASISLGILFCWKYYLSNYFVHFFIFFHHL